MRLTRWPDESAAIEDRIRSVPEAPRGRARWRELGPAIGLNLSASAVAGWALTLPLAAVWGWRVVPWLAAAIVAKAVIAREVGRLAACSGSPLFEKMHLESGRWDRAILILLIPQTLIAAALMAGLAGCLGAVLQMLLPGGWWLWTLAALAGSFIVSLKAARIPRWVAAATAAASIGFLAAAAVAIAHPQAARPDAAFVGGFFSGIFPWLGLWMGGASALIDYSARVEARHYGAAQWHDEAGPRVIPGGMGRDDRARLQGWSLEAAWDCAAAAGLAILAGLGWSAFGATLSTPSGAALEERGLEPLVRLASEAWGAAGMWLLLAWIALAATHALLSGQRAFSKMFSHAEALVAPSDGRRRTWTRVIPRRRWQMAWMLVALPAGIALAVQDPLGLLKAAGALEALLIPVVGGIAIWLGMQSLPPDLRPGPFSLVTTAVATFFFIALAALALSDLPAGAPTEVLP